MSRTDSGKRLELTARDIEIFKLLQRYRYLRSTFLYAFVGGKNETRFKERLGALFHDGRYINRPKEQWQFAGSRYAPAVYELDRAGEVVLAELGIRGQRAIAPSNSNHRQFAHTLMIAETLASMGTARGVLSEGRVPLGMSNNTSFLRPVSEGTVHGVGVAIHRGRMSWVWDVEMRDDHDRLCATSRVTIAVRDHGPK